MERAAWATGSAPQRARAETGQGACPPPESTCRHSWAPDRPQACRNTRSCQAARSAALEGGCAGRHSAAAPTQQLLKGVIAVGSLPGQATTAARAALLAVPIQPTELILATGLQRSGASTPSGDTGTRAGGSECPSRTALAKQATLDGRRCLSRLGQAWVRGAWTHAG